MAAAAQAASAAAAAAAAGAPTAAPTGASGMVTRSGLVLPPGQQKQHRQSLGAWTHGGVPFDPSGRFVVWSEAAAGGAGAPETRNINPNTETVKLQTALPSFVSPATQPSTQPPHTERIFIELMTSDRKLKATREGSK